MPAPWRQPAATGTCDAGWPRRALVWLALAIVYDLSVFGIGGDWIAEPICAFLCGLLAGLGVDLATRFEKWTLIPRHFFALGLVLLAIGGHWLAIRLIPGV